MFANLIIGLLFTTTGTPADTAPSTLVPAFMEYVHSIALTAHHDRAGLIHDRYLDTLATLDPGSMANTDLDELLVASLTASGLAHDRSIADHTRAIFDAMETRSLLEESRYAYMQELYVSLRDFDVARDFHAEFGERHDLDPIPAVIETPGFRRGIRTILVPDGKGSLRRQNFEQLQSDFVIVVADPTCHFTLDAVAAIQTDPALREYFSHNASWVAPDGLSLDLDLIATWNSTFQTYPMVFVDDVRSWPELDYWGTPTFYFFERGKVVRSIRGWPKEGRVDELKAALGLTRTGR